MAIEFLKIHSDPKDKKGFVLPASREVGSPLIKGNTEEVVLEGLTVWMNKAAKAGTFPRDNVLHVYRTGGGAVDLSLLGATSLLVDFMPRM